MNLTHYFDRHFEIIPANSGGLFEEILRLRYQVLCVENALLAPGNYINEQEWDRFDGRSDHRLIRHKGTGISVASVRLVLPDLSDPEQLFPIEEYCGNRFFSHLPIFQILRRESLAEVSRFNVSKAREREVIAFCESKGSAREGCYRRRSGLLCYLLLFGLFSAVVQMTYENNILHWYVTVEKAFHRLLKWFGIHFMPIGPLFDLYGRRLPCLGSTKAILSGIRHYRPEIWSFLTQGGRVVPTLKEPFGKGDEGTAVPAGLP